MSSCGATGSSCRSRIRRLPSAYQLRLVAPAITDRAGNPLGATDLVFELHDPETHTVEWIGSRSGFWDDPANWSSGVLPGPGDDVVINVASGGLIDHRAGATTIRSLTANGNLQLSGGRLELTGDSSISGAFTLTGGTLSGGYAHACRKRQPLGTAAG